MKKIKIIIATLCVAAIGIGVFLACHKEASEIDKSTSKLTQKDNPEIFNVRALYTDDTAINITLEKYVDGSVNITYTLSPAEQDDAYKIIVIDPTDEFPITYNEDSSMAMGLNPYDNENYIGWIFVQRKEPWEIGDPGVVTPGNIQISAQCYGCTQVGSCVLTITDLPFEGKKSVNCINRCPTCTLSGSVNTSIGQYENMFSSIIVFEADSTITINDTQLEPGDNYSIIQ